MDAPADQATIETTLLDPEFKSSGRLIWEPVNAIVIDKALRLSAMRLAGNYFRALYFMRQRVVKVRGHKGYIAVVRRESKGVGCLRGRLYTGIGGVQEAEVPEAVKEELAKGVPSDMAGISAFALPRKLRHLCRAGLGLVDCDISNAYFAILAREWPELTPQPIKQYVAQRTQAWTSNWGRGGSCVA